MDIRETSIPEAHAFDVDSQTGFMGRQPLALRLPAQWGPWEDALSDAATLRIQLGSRPGLSEDERKVSKAWRNRIVEMPVLSTTDLNFPLELRRAHLVLAFLLHFYVQSLPPDEPVIVPPPISIPALYVSSLLNLPPVLTFSDTVLYNWEFINPPVDPNVTPALDNIRSQTMFSGTTDEEEFYLCSARIELRGVKALEVMRMTMDEMVVQDTTTVRRVADHLRTIAIVIADMRRLLNSVRQKCDPQIYYNAVRPWFCGEDSDIHKRPWIFAGLGAHPTLKPPADLSGPSAGQSSLVHALDLFLGVDHRPSIPDTPSFMLRMQRYMPYKHRLFLDYLATNPYPLREFVQEARDAPLKEAYNAAVLELKEFRDAHMIIATMYILGPARRARSEASCSEEIPHRTPQGTGGTDLIKFLKDTRTRTFETLVE